MSALKRIETAETAEPPVARSVYADGGVVQRGRERVGITWAWCHVSLFGERVREDSGAATFAGLGVAFAGNNTAEYLALVLALEALPDHWSGPVFTDSGNTIGRFRDGWRERGIPPALAERKAAALARLGPLTYTLLGGHPTRADLARGSRPDGKPCSPHNVWCDKAAAAAGRTLKAPAEAR